jgi:hypothetical protein
VCGSRKPRRCRPAAWRERHRGARTRRGTPCQCKAIETKRGAWRCKQHGGKSTGPTSAEGRAKPRSEHGSTDKRLLPLDRAAPKGVRPACWLKGPQVPARAAEWRRGRRRRETTPRARIARPEGSARSWSRHCLDGRIGCCRSGGQGRSRFSPAQSPVGRTRPASWGP